MEIGEEVSIPELISDELHNEKTCPWHSAEPSAPDTPMKKQNPDDDAARQSPPNDGGELGRNLRAAHDHPPPANTVTLSFEDTEVVEYRGEKLVKSYTRKVTERQFPLQYAPHHLIPGNESLKNSAVVPYLGDNHCIGNYAKGDVSRIKDGRSTGYDVNVAENGVWLASPYALSNDNSWPAIPGIKALLKQKGVEVAQHTEEFKSAYVAAAIEASGGRQFHMRHRDYSNAVRDALKAIGERLELMTKGTCPVAAKSEEDGKFAPPMGLPKRLHVLSANLRGLLIGPVWRPPLYTDKLTEAYAEDLKKLGRITQNRGEHLEKVL